jgi:predicted ester cyclase
MTADEIKNSVRYALETAFNEGVFEPLEAITSAEIRDHSVFRDPKLPYSEDGFKQRILRNRAAFPDIHYEVEHMILEGEMLALNWTISGTNTGSLRGQPPTGKRVSFTGMNIERMQGGKIVEHWSNPDFLGMWEQMGYVLVKNS